MKQHPTTQRALTVLTAAVVVLAGWFAVSPAAAGRLPFIPETDSAVLTGFGAVPIVAAHGGTPVTLGHCSDLTLSVDASALGTRAESAVSEVRSAAANLSDAIGVRFEYVPHVRAAVGQADISVVVVDTEPGSPTVGYTQNLPSNLFATGTFTGADVQFSTTLWDMPTVERTKTILHEFGHVAGLAHAETGVMAQGHATTTVVTQLELAALVEMYGTCS